MHAPMSGLARLLVSALAFGFAVAGRSQEAPVHTLDPQADAAFIRDWLVVGPFPSEPLARPTLEGYTRDGFGRDFLGAWGGEPRAVLESGAVVPGVGRPQPVHAEPNGAVDLTRVFGEGERRVGYLFTWIDSPADQTLTFFFSSDDGGQVWVNGERVHVAWVPGGRGVRFREETFRANLKRGRNRMLVKVEQNGPGWAAAVEALPRAIAPSLLRPSLQLRPRIQLLDREDGTWRVRIAAELNHDATLFPELRQRIVVRDTDDRTVFEGDMDAGAEAVIRVEPGAYLLTARADVPKPMGGEAALIVADDSVVFARDALTRAREWSGTADDDAADGWFLYLAEKLERALEKPGDMASELALQTYRVAWWNRALELDPRAFTQQRGSIEWAYRSRVDGSGQPFTLWIPEDYSAEREWPLVVQLHGAGGTHGERWGDPHRRGMFELQVNGRGRTGGYTGLSGVDVLEALEYVRRHWRIASGHIHLTGGSMGGYGAFTLASRHPDLWASAVPWAGSAAHLPTENMINLPVYALHSDDDRVVPVSGARAGVRWLNRAGGTAILAETTGLGHQFGRWTEGRSAMERWRDGRTRVEPRTVRRILYTATDEGATGAHWMWIDEWGPRGAPASVHARFDQDNALYLDARNARVVRVALDASPADRSRSLHVSVNGRPATRLEPPLPGELFVLPEEDPRVLLRAPELPNFRLHYPGGVAALYHGEPLLVVYGTAGRTEITARLRTLAEAISKWSHFPSGGELSPEMTYGALPVRPDHAVTDEDLDRSNIILIGSEAENTLAARLAKHVPVSVDPAGQRLVADDGQSWTWSGRGLGLLHYNPEFPQRLLYWITASDAELYDPGGPLVTLNGRREPAPDFLLAERDRVVAARRFDSRWSWEPGYAGSPRVDTPANEFAAEQVRRALACDFVVQEHANGNASPWRYAEEARIADIAAFAYSHRLATFTLSGAELRQAAAALANGPVRIWPKVDVNEVEDGRRYRIGLVGLDMRGFVRSTRLEPDDFALVDQTLRDVLWPE